jgi:hypothetical protein
VFSTTIIFEIPFLIGACGGEIYINAEGYFMSNRKMNLETVTKKIADTEETLRELRQTAQELKYAEYQHLERLLDEAGLTINDVKTALEKGEIKHIEINETNETSGKNEKENKTDKGDKKDEPPDGSSGYYKAV